MKQRATYSDPITHFPKVQDGIIHLLYAYKNFISAMIAPRVGIHLGAIKLSLENRLV